MIEIASAIGRSLAPVGGASGATTTDGAAFALSLASFLSLQDDDSKPGSVVTTPAVPGQDDATGGNALPDEVEALPEMGVVPFMAPMPVPMPVPMPEPVRSDVTAQIAVAGPSAGMTVQQGGASARPAMLAGTGLAVVQTATAAAETPATVEMPPVGSTPAAMRDLLVAATVPPEMRGAAERTGAVSGNPPLADAVPDGAVRRAGPGAADRISMPQVPVDAGAMVQSDPRSAGIAPDMAVSARPGTVRVGSAMPLADRTGAVVAHRAAMAPTMAAVPVPTRFVKEAVMGAGTGGGASQEVPVSTPFLKAPVMGAALDVPVPARFAVPAAAPATLPVGDIAADVARVAVATDAGVAAQPPVGEVGQVAHDLPGPARSDGAVANVADRGVTLPASLPAVPVADAPGPIKAGDAAPAFQVFASALHRDAALREDRRAPVDALAAPGLVAPVTTVAPTMAAQDAPLDMRQDQWPQGMIDRIEALRDQADAHDTRIRLVPDALGTIDIAISRRDDQVHVRFEAEQAQTRAMLAQAQPELTALASARGLKLGEAGVDPGQQQAAGQNSGQNGAFTQQQQQPRTMRNRTASAAPADSVADDTADAMRIA